MNRKLLILDIVLVAVLGYAGYQFRNMWKAAKAREAAQLRKKYPPAPPPAFPPLAQPPAVMATGYVQIPQKMLFDPSRNSVVPVEAPPPPPPPEPMPALPVYHGQMNLGDGAGMFAILSVSNAAPHEAIHLGETIGQFKLLSVNKEGIDLEWKGQTVHKSLDELSQHSAPPPQQASAGAVSIPAPPVTPVQEKPLGPGATTGRDNLRMCQANDSMAEGTVVDGYKKVLKPSPFGNYCYWEPLGGTGGR